MYCFTPCLNCLRKEEGEKSSIKIQNNYKKQEINEM